MTASSSRSPGKSTLQFRPRQDGGLSAVWISADGKTSMTGSLKPIDPGVLTEQHAASLIPSNDRCCPRRQSRSPSTRLAVTIQRI